MYQTFKYIGPNFSSLYWLNIIFIANGLFPGFHFISIIR